MKDTVPFWAGEKITWSEEALKDPVMRFVAKKFKTDIFTVKSFMTPFPDGEKEDSYQDIEIDIVESNGLRNWFSARWFRRV